MRPEVGLGWRRESGDTHTVTELGSPINAGLLTVFWFRSEEHAACTTRLVLHALCRSLRLCLVMIISVRIIIRYIFPRIRTRPQYAQPRAHTRWALAGS
jgi:hypothetical protein